MVPSLIAQANSSHKRTSYWSVLIISVPSSSGTVDLYAELHLLSYTMDGCRHPSAYGFSRGPQSNRAYCVWTVAQPWSFRYNHSPRSKAPACWWTWIDRHHPSWVEALRLRFHVDWNDFKNQDLIHRSAHPTPSVRACHSWGGIVLAERSVAVGWIGWDKIIWRVQRSHEIRFVCCVQVFFP